MSERMTPIPFPQLMNWLFTEHETQHSVFGVTAPYVKKDTRTLPLFKEKLETPFGPAAGPNSQLAQNIIAAYYAGSRFFELKTVQRMDGAELAACVPRPCILAEDEGYNCEWSTELTVPQAFDEYVKAWFALKLISKKWSLGSPDGFAFNMSVGYDLAGVQTEKLDRFINGLKDASPTPIWQECMEYALAAFPEDAAYIRKISPVVCTGVTVSTLHGCPPEEIESIASYLISEKQLNTFVKCNPTLLGYDYARSTMDEMGYDYLSFDDHHFREDLQYDDAVPMFVRLNELAAANGLEFGLKLSNTFPVKVTANELPSEEIYMSGKSLYPLTIEMANCIARDFNGKLRLSYSGGADYFNIKALYEAGIWPITMATTVLKPGGYSRMTQIAQLLDECEYKPFSGVNVDTVAALAESARTNKLHIKSIKPLPSRKIEGKVPLVDCFTAPCTHGCPIGQDIPEYVELCAKGKYYKALKLITEKNPLPFITGTICAHHCMDKCTRNFYEDSVEIRATKLLAAEKGYDALMATLQPTPQKSGRKTAIIGGGPAGLAAAYFIAREGLPVTLFERENKPGGIVRNVIPSFRIDDSAIDKDVALIERMGCEFVLGKEAPTLAELREQGYENILLAFGAEKSGNLNMPGNVMNVIDFLKQYKNDEAALNLGENVVIIGGGNTAMDSARAAKRVNGVKRVSIVYRRTKKYMPADIEELEMALADGVEFAELLAPVKQEDGKLICKRVILGEVDASGRRKPIELENITTVPADTVIAAVGEKPCEKAFARYGVKLSENGRATFKCESGVYVAGDALRGPATVVEAIADAQRFANTVCEIEHAYNIPEEASVSYGDSLAKKGILKLSGSAACEAERCLNCGAVCENCVSVCPNRANIAISVPGRNMRQILHVDYMCNECGNCAPFCPYSSSPYLDKFTLFRNEEDFMDSKNNGFAVLCPHCPEVRVRVNGYVADYNLGKDNALDKELETLILTVIKDYSYLL